MRLIDADALWNALNDAGGTGAEHGSWADGWDKAIDEAICLVGNAPTIEPAQQWIPVAERLPEDCDERFYMCVVENHESDPPMYLQYSENTGFGLWSNVFDEHTLGFVGSDFSTNEELGYEKVLAWLPLPEPYTAKVEDDDNARRVKPLEFDRFKNDTLKDVQPVVHGKWKPVRYTTYCSCGKSYETYHFLCTACNHVAYAQPYGLKYCPNCGAKMDKEVNDDD